MGIPKYFREITKENPNLILDKDVMNTNIHNLYLDFNCLIHPVVKKIEAEYQHLVKEYNFEKDKSSYQNLDHITKFELKVYQSLSDYLEKIINYANPLESIYISIDGVAPRAKMEQQRLRRYRSILVNQMKNEIYKKHNIEKFIFDSNCITPGTLFMIKLSNFLKKFLKNTNYDINLYLDDSSIIGEGEHKILQHIKNNNSDKVNCIYGLDADLIMLSLVSGSKIYLLRESVHFGKVDMETLLFFDVQLLSENLFVKIKSMINLELLEQQDDNENQEEIILKNRIINDYVCLCFFIGNDFLPSIQGLDINIGSINSLLDIYCSIFSIRRKYLVDESNNINFIFVRQILSSLFSNENKYLLLYQKKIDNFKPRILQHSKLDIEINSIDYYPIYNKCMDVKLGNNSWLNDYYLYYFNISNPIKDSKYIRTICNNYIEGLQWNIKYYLDKCVSYSWYYRYRSAPLLKDLCLILNERIYPSVFTDIQYSPLEQLSIVLPLECQYLWCKDYREKVKNNIKLRKFYPNKFMLDTLNKKFIHECEPILCEINAEIVKEYFKKCKLTEYEKLLNTSGEIYSIEKNNIRLLINNYL